MHRGESVAIARTVGHLSKSAEVMKLVNNLMKAPQMAVTMQEFSKEMTKAGVIEAMVNDAVDNALDSEDIEEEAELEIDKVLTAIAAETAAQLPEAIRKENLKQPVQSVEDAEENADDEEELEEIRARLARVRSLLKSLCAKFVGDVGLRYQPVFISLWRAICASVMYFLEHLVYWKTLLVR
ncbi:vacuolar protein sorting-associated protein 24 homolog 1-like isoform X1 [Olea europaea var. sylvestris]|uniref:vacuolar protein sorting-associated protein 24 homolog 1-like isoform X1 n=2 Tax=Olea europaea var. sylvestris TaxID=158386 RepID=UPI000C1D778C|nr:vacuolar protein sorting-associated protein 24 homolog 1-like isoform X1 [Olea europaea var. sylvestris]